MSLDLPATMAHLGAAIRGEVAEPGLQDPTFQELAAIMARTAASMAADLWPGDPAAARAAGVGMLGAASCLGLYAKRGGEATMLNAVALIGYHLLLQNGWTPP